MVLEKELFILVDADAGIDDAWAILMILAASKERFGIKVLGITCVFGNTNVNQTCINVLRTLDSSNRLDIPVFKGASAPIIDFDKDFMKNYKPFFGADGFGNAQHDNYPKSTLLTDENAVVALNRIVNENKNKVSLLCCGPLTNIALAIRTFSTFSDNVKEVIIMGGNYKAVGNTTDCAEFNFFMDPEAAHIVLNSSIKNKVLVPWETCLDARFSLEWRDNILGNCSNAAVQLLNHVERPLRAKPSFVDWCCCDQVAAGVLLDPAVATESERVHLTVELGGRHTRGQVVVGHKQRKEANTTLIKAVDKELFEKLLLKIHNL